MSDRINLKEWVEAFDRGDFDAPDFDTQVRAGWYDWFCNTSSLRNKLYRMAPKVKQFARSPKINPEKVYVWFKNNCPCDGELYDDFRIADLETGDALFCAVPRCGHRATPQGKRSILWGESDDSGEWGVLVKGEWKDIRRFMSASQRGSAAGEGGSDE